jgi:uncharacterized membrane protein HdeD (DUF308 family)
MATATEREASAGWGGPFVLGLLVMAVGVLALLSALWTGLASIILLGILLAISGVLQIGYSFGRDRTGSPGVHLLAGILSAVVGVLIAARPAIGLAALTLLLAGYFFASGLFRTITSVVDRYARWGWDFAYGISAIILGIILVASWPTSAAWLVGTLVGLEIIFRGASLMAASLALRRLVSGRATA